MAGPARGVRLVTAAIVVCLSLTALAPLVHPGLAWWLGVLTLAYPSFFCLAIVLFGLGLVRRCRWSLLSLGPVLAAGSFYAGLYGGWHRQRPGALNVATLNCNYFQGDRRGPVRDNIHAVLPLLQAVKPDILCLQDYSTDSAAHNALIDDYVRDQLGLRYKFEGPNSLTTRSRFPILAYQTQQFPDSENAYSYVDVSTQAGQLRVFNVHLESYAIFFSKGWKDGVGRLRSGLQARAAQAERLAECISGSPSPVIVCGDFNDVPTSYAYRCVATGLHDGFRCAGEGWGSTYNGPIPGLRIDYILGSPDVTFSAYEQRSGPRFLDHKMVTAAVSLRPATPRAPR